MKTIFVDDEIWMLQQFKNECVDIEDIEIIGEFTSPLSALKFARENPIELAFLDIEMPEMDGLELCDKLREISPKMIVVFVSAYDKYMPDAFGSREADYFLVKPYRKQDVEAVIERAKLLSRRLKKRIYAETFGNFNLYLDDVAISFSSEKARELMALLVQKRGTRLTSKEALCAIWESEDYDHDTAKLFFKAMKKLKDILEKAGIGDLLLQDGNGYRLETTKMDSDLFQFLDGNAAAIRKYTGEYMLEYAWGEEVCGYLTEEKRRLSE